MNGRSSSRRRRQILSGRTAAWRWALYRRNPSTRFKYFSFVVVVVAVVAVVAAGFFQPYQPRFICHSPLHLLIFI